MAVADLFSRGKQRRRKLARAKLDREGRRTLSARNGGAFGADTRVAQPGVSGGSWSSRSSIGFELSRELERLSDRALKRALEKRLVSLRRCGSVIQVRSCGGCGSDREGSGTYEGVYTCKTRVCPTCAWVRSRKHEKLFDRAFDEIPEVPGFCWKLLVLTTKYDPRDPAELTWESLRSRALLCGKLTRAAWKHVLKQEGAAMFMAIEVGTYGHVHANLLYYGPEFSRPGLETVLGKVDPRAGHVNIQRLNQAPEKDRNKRVREADSRGSKEALKRAARYVTKPVGHQKGTNPFDEAWLAGERLQETMNPLLLARWEIATRNLKLTMRYGKLRGIPFDENDMSAEPEFTDDAHIPCRCCGAVGQYETKLRRAEEWIQDMHDAGLQALVRSKWKPYGGGRSSTDGEADGD